MIAHRPVVAATALGLCSLALYALLFLFADELVGLAERTRQGDKLLFLVPIAIAFLFSWIHGSFTGQFWEALGIRAAGRHK